MCIASKFDVIQIKLKLYLIFRNFRDVGYGEEFLSLTAAKLIEFISSDDLQVFKEETVFQAVIRWFNHNPDERRPDFHKVVFKIVIRNNKCVIYCTSVEVT